MDSLVPGSQKSSQGTVPPRSAAYTTACGEYSRRRPLAVPAENTCFGRAWETCSDRPWRCRSGCCQQPRTCSYPGACWTCASSCARRVRNTIATVQRILHGQIRASWTRHSAAASCALPQDILDWLSTARSSQASPTSSIHTCVVYMAYLAHSGHESSRAVHALWRLIVLDSERVSCAHLGLRLVTLSRL